MYTKLPRNILYIYYLTKENVYKKIVKKKELTFSFLRKNNKKFKVKMRQIDLKSTKSYIKIYTNFFFKSNWILKKFSGNYYFCYKYVSYLLQKLIFTTKQMKLFTSLILLLYFPLACWWIFFLLSYLAPFWLFWFSGRDVSIAAIQIKV